MMTPMTMDRENHGLNELRRHANSSSLLGSPDEEAATARRWSGRPTRRRQLLVAGRVGRRGGGNSSSSVASADEEAATARRWSRRPTRRRQQLVAGRVGRRGGGNWSALE